MKRFRKILSAMLSAAVIAACALCGTGASAQTATDAVKATPLTDWNISRNWVYVGADDYATVQPLGFTSAYGLKVKAETGKGTGVDFGKIKSSGLFIGVKYEADNYYSVSEDGKGIILYLKTETANDMVLNVLFDRNGAERTFAPKVGSSYQYAALGDDSWTDATAEAGGLEGSVYYGSFGFDGPFEGYVKVPFTSLVRDAGGTMDFTQDKLKEVKLQFKTLGESFENGAVVGPVMIVTEESASVKIEVPEKYRTAPVQATPLTDWNISRNWVYVGADDYATVQPLGFTSAYGLKVKAETGKGTGVDFGKIKSSGLFIGVKYEADNYYSVSEDGKGIILYLKTETANDMVLNVLFDRNGAERTFAPKVGSSYQYAALGDDSWTDATAEAGGLEGSVYYGSFGFDGPFEGYVKVPFTSLVRDAGGTMDFTQDKLKEVKLQFKTLGESFENGAVVGPVMVMTEDSRLTDIEVPDNYKATPIEVKSVEFKKAQAGMYNFSVNSAKIGYDLSISKDVMGEDEKKFELNAKEWTYVEQAEGSEGNSGYVKLIMQPTLPIAPCDSKGFLVYLKTDAANTFSLELDYESRERNGKQFTPELHLKPGASVSVMATSAAGWTEKTVAEGKTGNSTIYGKITFDAAFEGYIKIPYSALNTDVNWTPNTVAEDGSIDRITNVVFRFKGIGGKVENGLYGGVTAGLMGYVTADSPSSDRSINKPVYKQGDVNNDWAVNSADLIELRKYLLGADAEINIGDANVDRDENSQVNIVDLIRLKKIISEVQ